MQISYEVASNPHVPVASGTRALTEKQYNNNTKNARISIDYYQIFLLGDLHVIRGGVEWEQI